MIDISLIIKRLKTHLSFDKDIELANYLGIKQSTLATWKHRGNIDVQLIISKCKEINPNWLLTGEGPMIKESPFQNTNQNTDNKMDDLKMMDYLISEVNYLRKKLDTQEDERKQLRLLAEKLIDENRTLMSLVTNTSEPKKKEAI